LKRLIGLVPREETIPFDLSVWNTCFWGARPTSDSENCPVNRPAERPAMHWIWQVRVLWSTGPSRPSARGEVLAAAPLRKAFTPENLSLTTGVEVEVLRIGKRSLVLPL